MYTSYTAMQSQKYQFEQNFDFFGIHEMKLCNQMS